MEDKKRDAEMSQAEQKQSEDLNGKTKQTPTGNMLVWNCLDVCGTSLTEREVALIANWFPEFRPHDRIPAS